MPTNYIATASDITSLADAIRTKGGTSASLTWPSGFVTAINAISTADTTIEDKLVARPTNFSEYTNSRITIVGKYAFAWQSTIQSFTFPNCVTIDEHAFDNATVNFLSFPTAKYIGSYAFFSCKNPSSFSVLEFPEALTIYNNAFQYCNAEISVLSLPKVTSVGPNAFASAWHIHSVYLPNCTTVEQQAFYNCGMFILGSEYMSIHLPKAKTFGASAFNSIGNISFISLPQCTGIVNEMFANCTKLESITVSTTCSRINQRGFFACTNLINQSWFSQVTYFGDNAFNSCKAITEMKIPQATSIGTSTFAYCYSLNTVVVSNISAFKGSVFQRAYNLLSLYILSTSIVSFGTAMFSSTPISNYTTSTGGVYGSIYVRASLLDSYKTAASWSVYSARMVGLTDAQVAEILGT